MAMKQCDSNQGQGKEDEFNPDACKGGGGMGFRAEGITGYKYKTCYAKGHYVQHPAMYRYFFKR